MVNEAMAKQDAPDGLPSPGQLLQQALGRGDKRAMGNVSVCIEAWEEMCAALQMTPQRSTFQLAHARVGSKRMGG